MQKAIEALVSRDSDNQSESTRRTVEAPETALRDQLSKALLQPNADASKPSRFGQEILAALEKGTGRPGEGPSLYDIKLFGNKVLKKLREDLALAQSAYIKTVNADVMKFELDQGPSEDALCGMDRQQLGQELKRLRQEILALRLSEAFLRKLCGQVLAINDCLPLCSLQQSLAGIVDKIHANELKTNKYSDQTKA